jgi:hypothetical protein
LSFCVSANFTTIGDEQPYENTKTKGQIPPSGLSKKFFLIACRLYSTFNHCQTTLLLIHTSDKTQLKRATVSNVKFHFLTVYLFLKWGFVMLPKLAHNSWAQGILLSQLS